MKRYITIGFTLLFLWVLQPAFSQDARQSVSFNFYGDSVQFNFDTTRFVDFTDTVLSEQSIANFYEEISQKDYAPLLDVLKNYKATHKADDWLYYQLVRKAAQYISPKADNYWRYTLYKWYFLAKSGYDARLVVLGNKLLFYVYCEENVYNIPFFRQNNRQYVCLNYHDYGFVPLPKEINEAATIALPNTNIPFSYKISQLPNFTPQNNLIKDLAFEYNNKNYHFKVDLNPEVDTIFKNYPVVDFESYFNIPLSPATYASLIPMLKKAVAKMTQVQGIDYLMEFTRNAFLYEDDYEHFGKEKRMPAQQTLFNKYSDCDDRVALFFYLVKELYNRPMIVLLYPTHVTVAVNFTAPPRSNAIVHNNLAYSVCEPTPQQEYLAIGQIPENLKKQPYTIVYTYTP